METNKWYPNGIPTNIWFDSIVDTEGPEYPVSRSLRLNSDGIVSSPVFDVKYSVEMPVTYEV